LHFRITPFPNFNNYAKTRELKLTPNEKEKTPQYDAISPQHNKIKLKTEDILSLRP
jgi:hypothetical protein